MKTSSVAGAVVPLTSIFLSPAMDNAGLDVPNVNEVDPVDAVVNGAESVLGAPPPNANVPNGTAGFVSSAGDPNENFAVGLAALVAIDVVAVKLPNVFALAVDLKLSTGLATPNVNVAAADAVVVAFDVAVVADESDEGFEPNVNFPLGMPKSMPPLPNVNFGVDVDVNVPLLVAVASLGLAC